MAGGLPQLNVIANSIIVTDPTGVRQPDNVQMAPLAGPHGSLLVDEMHGRWYSAAKRGNVFLGNTVIAGVALPVNAATVASKFTLWNPAGSGVDVELIDFALGIDSSTEVVNGLVAGIQPNVTTTGGAPGTLTELTTPASTYFGGADRTRKAKLYSAATLTNTGVLTNLYGLGINFDATAAGLRGGQCVFDGKIILPPDTIVTFLSTVAAITAAFCSVTWAEWPV